MAKTNRFQKLVNRQEYLQGIFQQFADVSVNPVQDFAGNLKQGENNAKDTN